ncbi:MAG: large repetitive protein [Verrucomicrobiota bacterium]
MSSFLVNDIRSPLRCRSGSLLRETIPMSITARFRSGPFSPRLHTSLCPLVFGISFFLWLTGAESRGRTVCLTDASPIISVEDSSVVEGNMGMIDLVFVVSLSCTSSVAVWVDFLITGGTASTGVDYITEGFGTVEFSPGETNRLIEVPVVGETLREADETLSIALSNPVNGTLGRTHALGTILNDDYNQPPAVRISRPRTESTFPTSPGLIVIEADASDTDGFVQRVDFFSSGQFVISATNSPFIVLWTNSVTGSYVITAIATDNEGLRATSAPVSISVHACATNQTTVVDLSTWSTVQFGPYPNGQGPASWTVSTGNTVALQSVNADASIFLSPFILQNDQIEGSWRVNVRQDDDFMGFVFGYQDDGHFYLFDWKGADQSDPDWGFAERGMSVKVMTANSPLTRMDYGATTPPDGTRARSLYHNLIPWADRTDYQFSLQFAPGRFTITVTRGATVLATIPINDSTYTSGKFGFYNFSQGSVEYTGFVRHLLTPIPVISVANRSVVEGNSGTINLVFQVSLSGLNCEPTEVDYYITPGTAMAGQDYSAAASGTITFAQGETNKLVTVTVFGDTLIEPNETLFINLTNPVNGVIFTTRAEGTIINDDTAHIYSVAAFSDGNGSVTLNPLKPFYSPGDLVQLSAIPARWHLFQHWNDGDTANPRLIAVDSNVNFTATFIASRTFETLECGGVVRVAPVGTPVVFVNGTCVFGSNISTRGQATVSLSSTFPNATFLFTQDGSDPGLSARLYEKEFTVRQSTKLRAIAYSSDFSDSAQCDAIEITILPTLTGSTEGGGTISIEPPFGAYFSNETATATATPLPGWTFLQWLGDASGPNPVAHINMTRDKRARAVFGTGLSNFVVGSGSIIINPPGNLYPYGAKVWLTAVPHTGNYFAFWGNAATGTNNPLSFTITNANPILTAVFASLSGTAAWALTVIPNGLGLVTNSPRANRYGAGTILTLTAVAESGQSFLGWAGDASGSGNPMVVTMTQSKVITANFTKRPRLEAVLCGSVGNGEEFQLLLTGNIGDSYGLEATTSLSTGAMDWIRLGTVTNTFWIQQFNDPLGTNGNRRFYRAVVP